MTVIVKVFQMMNEPTNSAMPAKIPKRMPTIWKFSFVASAFSLATAAPVTASVPCGITCGQPVGELGLAHALLGADVDAGRRSPGVPSTCCAVAVSKYADVVPPRSLIPSPYPTVPTTVNSCVGPWNRTLIVEPSAMSWLLGAGGVDGDLVRPLVGACPESSSTSPRSSSSAGML